MLTSSVLRCRARKAEDHLPPSRPSTGRRVWPEVPVGGACHGTYGLRVFAGTAHPYAGHWGGVVVVVAPLSAWLGGFSRVGGIRPRPEKSGAWSAKLPPEAPAAEMRLKEVTSAPKHVLTSAS